jgi:hypothetical protein
MITKCFLLILFSLEFLSSENNLCKLLDDSSAYAKGFWQLRSEAEQQTAITSGELFECCDGNASYDLPICQQAPKVPYQGCRCRDEYYEANQLQAATTGGYRPEFMKYEWKPDNCELTPWDARLFCSKLQNRHILMVGDESMAQTHGTLFSMIYQSSLTAQESAQCMNHIRFQYSAFLAYQALESEGQNLMAATRGGGFGYDLTIMGTGAHYDLLTSRQNYTIDDEGFGNYFFPKLLDDLEYIRRLRKNNLKLPKTTFVWKTENPGHPHCSHYSEPLKVLKSEEEMLLHSKFHWENTFHLDKKVQSIAKEHDIKIFDMHPLFLRPDAHPKSAATSSPVNSAGGKEDDCFHYCAPGPLNYFGRVFLQALLNEEL